MGEGSDPPEDLTPYCEPHLARKDQLHFHLQNSRKEKKKVVLTDLYENALTFKKHCILNLCTYTRYTHSGSFR